MGNNTVVKKHVLDNLTEEEIENLNRCLNDRAYFNDIISEKQNGKSMILHFNKPNFTDIDRVYKRLKSGIYFCLSKELNRNTNLFYYHMFFRYGCLFDYDISVKKENLLKSKITYEKIDEYMLKKISEALLKIKPTKQFLTILFTDCYFEEYIEKENNKIYNIKKCDICQVSDTTSHFIVKSNNYKYICKKCYNSKFKHYCAVCGTEEEDDRILVYFNEDIDY